LDWWARVDEKVVELKSSEEYYRAADHYMKKGVYPREVVLQMKEAETIISWEKRIIQPEIPETLDITRRKIQIQHHKPTTPKYSNPNTRK